MLSLSKRGPMLWHKTTKYHKQSMLVYILKILSKIGMEYAFMAEKNKKWNPKRHL